MLIPIQFCSPFVPSLLTWNPPCRDRIRPPRTQVARKLTSHFPPLSHIPPIPKSRPPAVPRSKYTFIRTTSEPGSQDRARSLGGTRSRKKLRSKHLVGLSFQQASYTIERNLFICYSKHELEFDTRSSKIYKNKKHILLGNYCLCSELTSPGN